MSLCKLCSSISLDGDGLPAFPDGITRDTWRYIYPLLNRFQKAELIGFPFHPNLESLKSSAKQCDLCDLILSSIEKAIEELQNPDSKNLRRPNDKPKIPTWELWVTRRQEIGPGFCVFTNCEESKDFHLVAAVGICVKEGDPLESQYSGRPVEEDSSSSNSTVRVTNWVNECNKHPTCHPELPPLPARVIDVGDEVNGYYMKLRETDGETGQYIGLSHCWGKVTQFTTTKASLAAHKTNIDYDELPQSFKDAIKITRLLGIRYIWIDSICICQDDGQDWERESARMTSIYMNSYLTIAASAAEDSSVGCFIPRRPPKYVGIQYTTKQGNSGEVQAFLLPLRKEVLLDLYLEMADHIGETDHPLATRAWAVQERVLPRRTLHFGKHQMYFECDQGFRGENGLHLPSRYYSIHFNENEKSPAIGKLYRETTPRTLWRAMLWNYGPRKLTEPSDKLPAISGLARLFAERLDDEYVAGLWRKTLVEDLMWQGLSARRVPKRAPSWSWASIDGIPATGIYEEWEPLAIVIDYKVQLKGENAFGEVNSAWIKLQAPLVPLLLDPLMDPDPNVPYNINPRVSFEKGDSEGFVSRFDFPFTAPTARQEALAIIDSLKGVNIFALILLQSYSSPKNKESSITYHALILREAEEDSSTMQRLGFLLFGPEEIGECSQLDHPEERPIVTLV